MNTMKQFKKVNGEEFEVISSSDRCIQCRFQCEIVLDDNDTKQIYLSCEHPVGPGDPVHCAYFKKMK